MFSFNFASKMLNTIMGTEDQPQQGGPGQPGPHATAGGQPGQGARPMGGGFQPVRPTPQGPGGSPRPGYGPPTFSGPRPTPGARPGPPTFGGPQRMGGPGMPHRFNGPQPVPGTQPLPGQRQPMQQPPGQPQPPQQQQQQQPQPGQLPPGMRGPSPMPGQGVGMGPMRPRGPSPLPAQQQQQQQLPPHQLPAKPAGAAVPDVDLSHLSAEEREMIESVMAKAQQLEQEGAGPIPPGINAALGSGGQPNAPRMIRPEDPRQGVGFGAQICPICRQRDMSGRDGMPGQECMECRTMVCKACGGMTPNQETKRPEWTCGNCIKRRRMGPPTTTIGNTAGPQGSLGPRPPGVGVVPGAAVTQFGQPPPSQPITSQNQSDWDAAARRPSTGGMMPGMQLTGSPQQQQQQRWESERESDMLESQEDVESWKNDVGQSRQLSSEIMQPPPPHLTLAAELPQEQLSQTAELYREGPDDREMMNPLDSSDLTCSTISTSTFGTAYTTTVTSTATSFISETYDYSTSVPTSQQQPMQNQEQQILPSPFDSNMRPIDPTQYSIPEYLPSTSVAGVNRPPSFAEVMRSRSQSIELEKGIMVDQMSSYIGSSSGGSRRASADSYKGTHSVFNVGSFESSSSNAIPEQIPVSMAPQVSIGVPVSMAPQVSTGAQGNVGTSINSQQSHLYSMDIASEIAKSTQPQASSSSGARQAPSIDEKANSLMEELSKLQSAVDSTLKRRQKQQQQTKSKNESQFQHRFTSPPRSNSPSPSPTSPVKEKFTFKTFESPSSPFRSPPRSDFRSPEDSPDSPEVPGVRKAIVLKEHDLDDYRSSSDEDSGSGSDEEQRKGVMGGIITSDPFYDHSPGEVYTIPEEEDEGGSPTGGDLVTSLSRPGIQGSTTENGSPRRRQEQGGVGAVVPSTLQPHTIRPQLRPQRSLDNRLPSVSMAGGQTQQDLIGNQLLDPQMQQQQLQNSNNNSQQAAQLGGNQLGRLDNQNLGGQINVNTSMSPTVSNQMGMVGAVGSTNIPGLLQQQSSLQQQQQNQQQAQNQHQIMQQQMQCQQAGFVSTSSVPTSTLDFHQSQNQFTMANNNQTSQQMQQQQHQQQQQPFGLVGSDTSGMLPPSSGTAGDWNSNLSMSGQTVQCSTNSMSPLPSSSDQQYGSGQLQQQQNQPYHQQQMNTFNQINNTQQQRPMTSDASMMMNVQQQTGLQNQMGMTGLQQQQQQQPGQQNQLQQQQVSMQNQMFGQDPSAFSNQQLQFQKNQMLLNQQSNLQGSMTGSTLPTSQSSQMQMQQIQTSQQQPFSQLGQPQQAGQQQLGQIGLGSLGGQHGQIGGISTSQSSQSLQNQLAGGLNIATSASNSQQWPQSSQSQMYDQNGRLISTNASQYAQGQQQQSLQNFMGMNATNQQQQQSQQLLNMQNQQYSQQQMLQLQQQQQSHLNQQQPHNLGMNAAGSAQIPTSTKSSIGGLLADFSRALGLGTSPRPSPSEDKSEPFPVPSSGVGAAGTSTHGQSYNPYQPHQPQPLGGQQAHHGLSSGQQIQQSAFTPIHEGSLAYLQRQQQQSYLQQHQQSNQSALQSLGGIQGLQYGTGIGLGSSSQLLSSSNQQYPTSLLSSQAQQQPTQVFTQSGLLAQQHQAGLSVGVVGALSPAQAHMYQQQMALQHQQQHMKKTSRRAHLSSGGGDVRRDGTTSTVLIGGQGLAVTPGGMTIGALTPAVVTSLGTFIGGSPAVLGTSLLQQPMAVTPLGTPIGTPVGTPRSGRDPGGDSSDTMSETDSQKSLRMRRKLPCLPPDQEAAPLPSTKKRERHRSQEFRSLSPMRLSSMDGTVPGRSYPFSSLSLSRPSASESNLRKLTMGASDPIPRPGSALGCLQASSVISSVGGKQDSIYPLGNILSSSPAFAGMALRTTTSGLTSDLTTTTSVLSGLYPSYKQSQDSWSSNLAELAAALPPDLRHLLNKGSVGGLSDHDLTGLSGLTSSLGDTSLNVGSHLPSYMRTLREQLQEERRQLLSEERRRLEALRERDRELGARLDAVTSRAGSEALRSRTDLSRNGGPPRSAGASPLLNRKLKGHRRQLSDPKLSLPFSPIQEDGDSELQDFDRVSAGLLRPPYKSFEYESLEDSALLQRPATALGQIGGDWDHSQSYLASSWAAVGGALRETAITSMGGVHEDDDMRNRMSTSRMLSRRSSDGEAWASTSSMVTRSPSSTREKRHNVRKHRKSRSWHPSPYVSEEEDEDEEDSLNREEKKARIKAEIARRRQQIQERAGLHGDIHVSRLPGSGVSDPERHSVLKSVDQLLRDQYGRYDAYGGRVTPSPASFFHVPNPVGYASGAVASSSHPSSHHHHTHHHHHSPAAHHHNLVRRIMPGGQIISPSSAEDRSMERIASTFRSDHDYASMLYSERYGEMMSPLATDSESMGSELGAPAAMPLLPDMPTRSRRLLEDLGSAPIGLPEGPSTRGGVPHGTAGQSLKGKYGVSAQGLNLPFRTVM